MEPPSTPTNGVPTFVCPGRSATMSRFAIHRVSASGREMTTATESERFTLTPSKDCGRDYAIFFVLSAA